MPASARPATISSAKALHLGEPHAPQSMPGSDSVMRRICSIFSMATDTSLSSRSAELAGIGSETGTVAPGKCADLIVTAANPLQDLRALRHVGMVMARGQLTGHPRFKRRPEVEAQLDRFLTDESGAAAR